MALIDDVATYLQAQGVGAVGTNIFWGQLPDSPDACIALYETGGFQPPAELPEAEPTIQIRARAASYTAAQTTIWAAFNALFPKTTDSKTLAVNSRMVHVQALQSPASIGKDQKGRAEFVVNFKFNMAR